MALDVEVLADGIKDLYGEDAPSSAAGAASAWADLLEEYIVDLTPALLTDTVSETARKSAASTALLTVFTAAAPDTATFATSMSTALGAWATAVGLTFDPPTTVAVAPLGSVLIAPLTATFVLNLALTPGEKTAEELQQEAADNIANTIDAWVKTGTATTSPGPPPVVVNWS